MRILIPFLWLYFGFHWLAMQISGEFERHQENYIWINEEGIFCGINVMLGWFGIQFLPILILLVERVIVLLFWIGIFQLLYREFPVVSVGMLMIVGLIFLVVSVL